MTSGTGTRERLFPGARVGSALLCGPTSNLAEQEGRYVRASAAVDVMVAIDELLRHKQYIHVVATGLMCIPPSAASRNLRPHDPSQPGVHLVSPRRRNSPCLRKTSMLSEKSRWAARLL
jgi:hypothetical protein